MFPAACKRPLSLVVLTILLVAAPPAYPQRAPEAGTEVVLVDFESGSYDGWTLEGDCWSRNQPAEKPLWYGAQRLSGWVGRDYATTANPLSGGGDPTPATGRALSRPFEITGSTIRFLIAGGRYPYRCCLNLLVDDQVVRTAPGATPMTMQQVIWDVRNLRGKTARLEIRDSVASGAYGFVCVDQIVMTGVPPTAQPSPPVTTPEFPPPAEPSVVAEEVPPVITEPPRPETPPQRVASARRPSSSRGSGAARNPRPPIAPFTTTPLPTAKVVVPLIFPVLGTSRWRDSYNVDRGAHRHTGIDISAAKMRPVVAPFSGVLGFKVETFWIYGDNGWKCLGTHLNDDTPGTNDSSYHADFMFAPNLRPGDRVTAGQFIGYVGNSGNATGPHLHFEMFDPQGTLTNPLPSLKAAQRLTEPRLMLSDKSARPAPGQVRIEGCPRVWDPTRRYLSVALVARQMPNGRMQVVTSPKRYRLVLPLQVIVDAGGPEMFAALPQDRAITFYVTEAPGGQGGTVRKMVIRERTEEAEVFDSTGPLP